MSRSGDVVAEKPERSKDRPWKNCCPSLYTTPKEDSTQGSMMSDEYVSYDYGDGQIFDAYKGGREEERTAIVAWLRESFFNADGPTFADLIESGDHLRDDNE